MIRWLSLEQLHARLGSYGPSRLHLRPFLHGRTKTALDATLERAPEKQVELGLGEVDAWSAEVDDVPLLITAARRRTGWGFQIEMPVHADGDVPLVAAIGHLRLPAWTGSHFEWLPLSQGHAVYTSDPDTPVYASHILDDAASVAKLIASRTDETPLVKPYKAASLRWIVKGPRIGHFISSVMAADTELEAQQLAHERERTTGALFSIARAD